MAIAHQLPAAVEDEEVALGIDRIAAFAAAGRLQEQYAAVATPPALFVEILGAFVDEEGFDELVLRDDAVAAPQAQAGIDAVAVGAGDHALPRKLFAHAGFQARRAAVGARGRVAIAATAQRQGEERGQCNRPAVAGDGHAAILHNGMCTPSLPRCSHDGVATWGFAMRLHLSPLDFLRRHAWAVIVVFVLVVGYFAAIGWIGGKLRTDLGDTYREAPAVEDRGHRAE
jgi:hypothetical protein